LSAPRCRASIAPPLWACSTYLWIHAGEGRSSETAEKSDETKGCECGRGSTVEAGAKGAGRGMRGRCTVLKKQITAAANNNLNDGFESLRTSQVAPLCQRDPQVCVFAPKLVLQGWQGMRNLLLHQLLLSNLRGQRASSAAGRERRHAPPIVCQLPQSRPRQADRDRHSGG